MSDQLCEYERQRLANIEKNNAMLMQLGVMQQKQEINVARSTAAASAQRVRVAQRLKLTGRSRASKRIAGQPGPEYREVQEPGSGGRGRSPRMSSGWLGGTRSREDFFATGFNNTVWPLKEEVAAAARAAESGAAASLHPASVKVMLPSHVAGGYWLQMPVDLTVHLPGGYGKHRFQLLDTAGKSWPVIWLRRGGAGGGLSGGWRGFAIDHELGVGDVVSFEKMVGNTLVATIHRAVSVEKCMAMAAGDTSARGSPPTPKRQRSAFAFFTKEKRAEIATDFPELASSMGEMQKKLGVLWRSMSASE
eukprot:COSAG05_NODE_5246_length_1227_cov_1.194149_1_plen_305_part_01